MTRWATLQYAKNKVNRAGSVLSRWDSGNRADFLEYYHSLDVINNWRAVHAFPLNTFQTTLRKKGRQIDPTILVAQRIKRLSSISLKLQRYPTMTLSQMQDIGGCRAIVSSVEDVLALAKSYQDSDVKHKLHTFDNYIQTPKPTGYRGIHLIYSYYSDRSPTYNNLKIEMQLRSQMQHAWATAVEIVGTFTRQALKSSQGTEDWLRFFALMGSAIAILEGTQVVPGTPTTADDLVNELRMVSEKLDAVRRLRSYGEAPIIAEEAAQKGDRFFLLELDMGANKLGVRAFKASELAEASKEYLQAEKRLNNSGDAVLVSVDSLATLSRAYPNYYFDTNMFVALLEDALRGNL